MREKRAEGMFLHTFENGELCKQGHIVGRDEDMILVQLFSWLDGRPTVVEGIPKSIIYSDRCILYATAKGMNEAYENRCRGNRWTR